MRCAPLLLLSLFLPAATAELWDRSSDSRLAKAEASGHELPGKRGRRAANAPKLCDYTMVTTTAKDTPTTTTATPLARELPTDARRKRNAIKVPQLCDYHATLTAVSTPPTTVETVDKRHKRDTRSKPLLCDYHAPVPVPQRATVEKMDASEARRVLRMRRAADTPRLCDYNSKTKSSEKSTEPENAVHRRRRDAFEPARPICVEPNPPICVYDEDGELLFAPRDKRDAAEPAPHTESNNQPENAKANTPTTMPADKAGDDKPSPAEPKTKPTLAESKTKPSAAGEKESVPIVPVSNRGEQIIPVRTKRRAKRTGKTRPHKNRE